MHSGVAGAAEAREELVCVEGGSRRWVAGACTQAGQGRV